MRLPGLDRPLGMYFDETLHVRTATEFLQPIRYGIPPREILEWTHPPLAKYAIAASVGLLGGHPLTGLIDAQVDTRDAAVEPARPASGPLAAQPSRLYLLAPEGVRIIDVDSGQSLGALPVEGGTALAVDGVNQRLLVGTVAGEVRAWSTVALALGGQVQSRVVAQAEAPVERVWSVGGTVATWAGDLLQLWTGDSPLAMPITDVVDLVALPGEPRRLAVLHAGGLRVLDATTFAELQTVPLPFGVTGMALVEGDDFENRNRGVMPYNLIYVAAAGSLERIEGIDDGGELRVGGRITVPGTAVDVDWNPATNIVHVLGTHAGAPAVFLMDPHGEAIFAETRLPYSPIAWSMDVRRDTPATDRQRLVVVAGDGRAATLAIGGTLAAARLPGALLGVAMIGLLYALARLLFRRRGLALLAGGLALLDGLLFAQSRIATPDVYTAFFVIAAYAALAAVVGPGERAPLPSTRRILAGLAAVGLLIGLAAATKWTGVYALGGAMFFCLLVAPGRLRWLAVGALAAGGGVLALRALAGSPPNVAFAGLVVGLVVLTALLVRRWEREPSALSWPVTGRQLAAGLGLMVGAALVTYFVLFLPYLGLDPARGDFIAAQLEMFRFHEGSVQAHGAGSPWWSWPLMLKPLWAYMESFAGTQAGIVMAANPVVVWLTSAAVAWGAARLVRRVDPALVLILVAFAFQWLIWARIDRVAFMYHYYTALPFAIVALAALLWRLWHAGTGRAWLYARVAVIVAAAIPAVLWVFADPLCGSLNVNAGAHVCAPDWSLSVPAPAAVLTLTVVVGGALASWWAWRALAVRGIEWARGVRGRTELVIVAGVIVGTLLAAHLVAGVPGFRFGLLLIPSRMVMAGLAVAVALIAGALVVRARSPRALVWGIVSAAAVLFMLTHPMIQAGLTWPGTVIAFQALLPTAEVSFTFARGTGPVLPVVLYIVLPLGAVALLGWLGLRSLDRRRARHLQGRLAGSDVSAEAAAGGEA
ncbi:MAG TPA: phospholipid carrier-dependent glycosyltransferase [Candidatus Limnocylindria bacterium]|nr:phospholipid carrier-dependent glycosyltransferase [Candidatus Limnocylindria bacterium]